MQESVSASIPANEPVTQEVIVDIENFRSKEHLQRSSPLSWSKKLTQWSESDQMVNKQNLETDDNLLSQINEKEETGARKPHSLPCNSFPGEPPPNKNKKNIMPPARETENKVKKENPLLAECSVTLMEEIAMLKGTIQDLSDARKQMLQQQDDNKQLQQEISKLQEKNKPKNY